MKFATVISFCFIALVMAECGYVKRDDDSDLTECQRMREKSKESTQKMKIIFDCDEDGSFKSLQCFYESKYCVCYSEDGHPISTPSTKWKFCDCTREKQSALDRGTEEYVAECEDDGYYSRKQCHGATGKCWCVDKFGKKLTPESLDPISC